MLVYLITLVLFPFLPCIWRVSWYFPSFFPTQNGHRCPAGSRFFRSTVCGASAARRSVGVLGVGVDGRGRAALRFDGPWGLLICQPMGIWRRALRSFSTERMMNHWIHGAPDDVVWIVQLGFRTEVRTCYTNWGEGTNYSHLNITVSRKNHELFVVSFALLVSTMVNCRVFKRSPSLGCVGRRPRPLIHPRLGHFMLVGRCPSIRINLTMER